MIHSKDFVLNLYSFYSFFTFFLLVFIDFLLLLKYYFCERSMIHIFFIIMEAFMDTFDPITNKSGEFASISGTNINEFTNSDALTEEIPVEDPALVTEISTDWISLKDYANELGISYEAVRQQVNKKQSELEGHIKNIGKTRFLDAEARTILSTKKNYAPRSIRQLQQPSSTPPVTVPEHKVSVVDIRHDMVDDRWTVEDYRARIRQLEDEKRDLEDEYDTLKSLLASMNIAEFRSWKKQQKKEWNDRFLQKTEY